MSMKRAQTTRTCPVCAAGRMTYAVRDLTIRRRGSSRNVPAVAGYFCDRCGEIEFDEQTDSGDRYAEAGDQLVLEARARTEAVAERLRRARAVLNITQAEANRIAGGGHNAFSRYESGRAKPVAAVVHLFALLERHPDLLGEVRELVGVAP
jgi:HTH-type transcriptional regulator/antitoxin MqsA